MDITLVNLFGVSVIAFAIPFVLGFFPRFRVPSIVLELIAGIIVGPALLGWIRPGPVVQIMSGIGVAFLLFLAGLELDLDALRGAPLVLGSAAFALSLLLGTAMTLPLGEVGLLLTPLLVTIALSATSVGIVVPVLRDTGSLDSPVGRYSVAGSSVAEFGTIAMLGVFFAGNGGSAAVESLLLAAVAVLAVLLLVALRRAGKWEAGRRILDRLDDTSSQVRVRFAVMILLASAVLAVQFGFEAILGTFLAGIVFGVVIRGDRFEQSLRTKLEAVGFGFFVPCFFITSGLKFDLGGVFSISVGERILLFVAMLLVIRALPAAIYIKKLGIRQSLAAGLLQATNLSFIVVAVAVGEEVHRLRPANGSALIAAGLISAVAFPAMAQLILGGAARPAPEPEDFLETL